MSIRRESLPIPIGHYSHGRSKNEISLEESPQSISSSFSSTNGSLGPCLSAPTPPNFIPLSLERHDIIKQIGKYAILEQTDVNTFKALDTISEKEYVVKIVPLAKYREIFAPSFRTPAHDRVNAIREVLYGERHAYVLFPPTYGDVHTFVRGQRKLTEPRASRLFRQIVSAVAHCHRSGVVLRDLKLRKFVFADRERNNLVLDNLEDSHILPNPDEDTLRDKHGCPAYVSPEILKTSSTYSGKCADVWSLGVILYTMLAGRYPFHDSELARLFAKIRRGAFTVPEALSPLARCLLHSILRTDPAERLTTDEILDHPWFHAVGNHGPPRGSARGGDQLVPDVVFENEEMFFFT